MGEILLAQSWPSTFLGNKHVQYYAVGRIRFPFPTGFSYNIQNSHDQEWSRRKGSWRWRPLLCSWDLIACPYGATTRPHCHTNFSWLPDVSSRICTSVWVSKNRSVGKFRSWLAILLLAEVQNQASRPRFTHHLIPTPHFSNPQVHISLPSMSSFPCEGNTCAGQKGVTAWLSGKEKEDNLTKYWQKYMCLRKNQGEGGVAQDPKNKYWPLTTDSSFFTWKSKSW